MLKYLSFLIFSIINKFRFKFKIEELVRELEGIPTFPISALGFTGQITKCLEERMRVDKSNPQKISMNFY